MRSETYDTVVFMRMISYHEYDEHKYGGGHDRDKRDDIWRKLNSVNC